MTTNDSRVFGRVKPVILPSPGLAGRSAFRFQRKRLMRVSDATPLRERLGTLAVALMTIPGLSGHEGRVRRRLAAEMQALGLATKTDRLGNLIATAPGLADRPTVMLFAHMDQLGFVVRKIEASGLIRLERVGGVPERALASQEVLICVAEGRDIRAVIANKSHHATSPEEKYRVLPYQEIMVDAGFSSADEVVAAGVDIGSPVVYAPKAIALGGDRLAGTAVDDRAGCAVIVEAARLWSPRPIARRFISSSRPRRSSICAAPWSLLRRSRPTSPSSST